MPFHEPDFTDPLLGIGVSLPGSAGATRDMAYAFAEEFARLGYSREKILHLFRTPFYRGAHGAYQALGEAEIQRIAGECAALWGRFRWVDQDQKEEEDLLHIEMPS